MKRIPDLLKDDSGLETLEYAVIGAIIAAIALLLYGSGWGGSLKNVLQTSSQEKPVTL